jgi:hypothetical protein
MILEIWHGGIPNDAPSRGVGSATQRISDKPFSIPWPLFVEHHMTRRPDLIVHVVNARRR